MRKPVAIIICLAFLLAYIIAVASLSGPLNTLPRWAQLPVYVVAGFAWAFPLRPVLRWMNSAPPSDPQ